MNVTTERTGEGVVYRAEPRPMATEHTTSLRHETTPVRDTLRWGPILGGLVTALAAMLVLGVLGLAVGLSALEDQVSGNTTGTFAAIWSAVSALIAFFLGGWVAGRTAGIFKPSHALLNGLTVGTAALALVLWLASIGAGNLLGAVGSNISDIARLGVETGNVPSNTAAQNAADNVRTAAQQNYDQARNGAWGTTIGLVLALGAATVGGLAGYKAKSRREGDLADPQY